MSRAVIAVYAVLVAASARGDQSAFADFHGDHPGAIHYIIAADLPVPFATGSAGNAPATVLRPANANPQALPGGRDQSIDVFASGLRVRSGSPSTRRDRIDAALRRIDSPAEAGP